MEWKLAIQGFSQRKGHSKTYQYRESLHGVHSQLQSHPWPENHKLPSPMPSRADGISGSIRTMNVTPLSSEDGGTLQKFNEPEESYVHRIQIYTNTPIDPESYGTLYSFFF